MRCGTIVAAAIFALSSGAVAGEIAKSGTLEGRFFAHNVQTIQELDTADGMKAYINEAFVFLVGNPPGDLFQGMAERCLGYGRYSAESGAAYEIGRCTRIDDDKDQVFVDYEVSVTGPHDANPGKLNIIGGTGKYKNITGTMVFTPEVWPPLSKTDTMWAGTYKGEYKIGN
jgi:hypothetical protein